MLLTTLLATMNVAHADSPGDLGIGAQLGYPLAFTAKKWLDEDTGLTAYVGVRAWGVMQIHARINYEKDFWTPPWEFGFASQDVFWLAGVGFDAWLWSGYSEFSPGVGGGIGYQLKFNDFPAEVYWTWEAHIKPLGFVLADYWYVWTWYGGIGGRWYF